MPDAISAFNVGGMPYIITANEGDSRLRPTSDEALPPLEEGDVFNEETRVRDVTLDPTAFPNFATLRANDKLGRLKITNTMGDTDGDGDYDALYSFGARSFSILNGHTGAAVYESGSSIEKFLLEKMPLLSDDTRSDDKGVEAEVLPPKDWTTDVGICWPRTCRCIGDRGCYSSCKPGIFASVTNR